MELDVHIADLGALLGGWEVNVIGARLSEHSRLLCGHDDRGRSMDRVVRASRTDHDRWCSATSQFLLTIGELQEREKEIGAHLRPPWKGRLLWSIRHARRNMVLRRRYDEASAKLESDFDAALAAYLAKAADLPEYMKEFARREKERQRRELEQARRRRLEAMEGATGPVWAYKIATGGRRRFSIYLTTVDRAHEGTHTPAEVQAALTAERAEHQYTGVSWGPETSLALKEKYETEASGWARLTGEVIIVEPIDPNDRSARPFSKYHGGPSSNYGSDGGAGGYAGGGGF
ncbi:hypothetical protein GCM10022247_49050 [Allokutzneria multivorans]|uniref:Uncharacterized protein n=1 Tax=Allokutzneria multivorans TaxID=1142134 RepID=A0ABP7T1W6_9PSEU